MPNQDYFLKNSTSFGTILAVADGVGSDQYSEMASAAICCAVESAFFEIIASPDPEKALKNLAEMIVGKFNVLLRRKMREAGMNGKMPSTTCIFAIHLYDLGLIIGQAGDGLLTGEINGMPVILQKKEAAFSNVVQPVCCNCSGVGFKIRRIKNVSSCRLMLATDGIADDILPGKEVPFALSVCQKVTEDITGNALEEILSNWETPNSNDDKTAGVYIFAGGGDWYAHNKPGKDSLRVRRFGKRVHPSTRRHGRRTRYNVPFRKSRR